MTAPAPDVPTRVCAVLLDRDDVCLIHRRRAEGDQYSLPGGLLHPGEPVLAGLRRELLEELDLDLASITEQPVLRWSQDQAVTRPGSLHVFRRRHLIQVLRIPGLVRRRVAATEQDAEDTTRVEWIDLREAVPLHLYPAVGTVLDRARTAGDDSGAVALPAITDRTYVWR